MGLLYKMSLKKQAEKGDVQAQYELGKEYKNKNNYEKAFFWFEKAANQGCAEAQYDLGKLCVDQQFVEADKTEAFKWYRKAAEQGYISAYGRVGHCYQCGYGVEKDLQEAIKWHTKAIESGDTLYPSTWLQECEDELLKSSDVEMLYSMGNKYFDNGNLDKAIKFLEKAADQSYPNAADRLGMIYLDKEDWAISFKWFKRAVENGYTDDCFWIALFYRSGKGVKRDLIEAIKWANKSFISCGYDRQWCLQKCEKDFLDTPDVEGQYKLGICYPDSADFELMIPLLEKDADQGDVRAQYILGLIFETKDRKEYGKAVEWFRKAAEQGYVKAQYRLGDYYSRYNPCHGWYKDYIKPDSALCFQWNKKAADQGYKDAYLKVATAYQRGEGVKKDLRKAIEWFSKAKDCGDKFGEFGINECQRELLETDPETQYETGYKYWLEDNTDTAIYYLKKAANRGHAPSQYLLGDIFDKNGTEEESFKWYKKASENGYLDAYMFLALDYEDGCGTRKNLEEAIKWYTKAAQGGYSVKEEIQRCRNELSKKAASKPANNDTIDSRKTAQTAQDETKYEIKESDPEDPIFMQGMEYVNKKEYKKALECFMQSAAAGNIAALDNCGVCYLDGLGVQQDGRKALEYFQKAADAGYASGMFHCGYCYQTGRGTPRDDSKALYYLKKAAELGNEQASDALEKINHIEEERKKQSDPAYQFNIGLQYYRGTPKVRADKEQAFYWFEKSANQGFCEAQKAVGQMYLNGDTGAVNHEKAFYWYSEAAEQGDAESQFNLGLMYHNGQGTAPDNKKSLYWFEKAAENGVVEAMYICGILYLDVNAGIQVNEDKGIFWLKKAAEQGNEKAEKALEEIRKRQERQKDPVVQFKIALQYYEGNGVAQNKEEALIWFEKAARQGHSDSQFSLASMYDYGDGIAVDKVKALYWYEKAAENGIIDSMYNCAIIYIYGDKGISVNVDRGMFWLQQAADKGHKNALNMIEDPEFQSIIGMYYIQENGSFQTKEKAFVWFEKAARQGNAASQFNLGLMYFKGDGVTVNKEKALYWYEKAAKQGDAKSQYNLGIMYRHGDGVAVNKEKALYYLEEAAKSRLAVSQFELGIMYYNGEGISADKEKALYWIEKAAANNFENATKLVNSLKEEVAWEKLERDAKNNNPNAQYELAQSYEFGRYIQENKKMALEWYRKAATNGNDIAAYRLGEIYDKGLGIEEDKSESYKWYKKSASKGNKDAEYRIAEMLEKGEAGRTDQEEADRMYRRAAEHGHPWAIAKYSPNVSKFFDYAFHEIDERILVIRNCNLYEQAEIFGRITYSFAETLGVEDYDSYENLRNCYYNFRTSYNKYKDNMDVRSIGVCFVHSDFFMAILFRQEKIPLKLFTYADFLPFLDQFCKLHIIFYNKDNTDLWEDLEKELEK